MSSCDSWNEIKGEKKMPELVPLERKKEALQNILKSALPKLTVSLPDNLREKAKKFAMGAFDCIASNPSLLEPALANPERLKLLVVEAARLGLWMGPTMGSDCHLVAFKDHGVAKLQLLTNYRGLEKLAYNTGAVASINTGTVHEGDIFNWDEGSEPFVTHKKGQERGETTHAWAAIWLRHSTKPIVRVMVRAEIDKVQRAAPSGSSQAGAWVQWWDEQAEKTVLKRALKKCPRSEELARALDLDDHATAGKEQALEDLGTFGGASSPEPPPPALPGAGQRPQESAPTAPGPAQTPEAAPETQEPAAHPEPAQDVPGDSDKWKGPAMRAVKSRSEKAGIPITWVQTEVSRRLKKPWDAFDRTDYACVREWLDSGEIDRAWKAAPDAEAPTETMPPEDWEEQHGKALRQKIAVRMKAIGCQTDDERHAYLAAQPQSELDKLHDWVHGKEGTEDLMAWLKERRTT